MAIRAMKILELFCGRGGWSKGFKQIFPHAEFYGIDVKDFGYPFNFIKADLNDWVPDQHYDIILASPPCSEFSEVKRNCAQPYDERQGLDLVWRTFHLIEKMRPEFWIIENVKGLAEFLPNVSEKIRYGKKTRKTAFLWSNKDIKLGFFDFDMSDYNSKQWHDKNSSGWEQCKNGTRGEIPLELSRQIALLGYFYCQREIKVAPKKEKRVK